MNVPPQTASRCPGCGHKFDRAANVIGEVEAVGDVTLCAGCLRVLFFDESGKAAIPTAAQLSALVESDVWPRVVLKRHNLVGAKANPPMMQISRF